MELIESVAAAASAGGPAPLAAVDPALKSRFLEQLHAEPAAAAGGPQQFYVQAPAAVVPSNPLVQYIEKLQALDVGGALNAEWAGRFGAAAPEDVAAPSSAGGLDRAMHQAVRMQAELVKTALTIESINSAKQGVNTLFQQQG